MSNYVNPIECLKAAAEDVESGDLGQALLDVAERTAALTEAGRRVFDAQEAWKNAHSEHDRFRFFSPEWERVVQAQRLFRVALDNMRRPV